MPDIHGQLTGLSPAQKDRLERLSKERPLGVALRTRPRVGRAGRDLLGPPERSPAPEVGRRVHHNLQEPRTEGPGGIEPIQRPPGRK